MGLFNKYPYTNFHELNLDFLLNQVKSNKSEIEKEAASRKHADELITSALESEAASRKHADELITSALESEVLTRTQMDGVLQSLINEEVTERTNADNTLSGDIAVVDAKVDGLLDDVEYVYDNGFASKNKFVWNGTDNIFTALNSTYTISNGEITISTTTSANSGIYIASANINEMLSAFNGKQITMSAEVKSSGTDTVTFGLDSSRDTYEVDGTYKKISHTLLFNSSATNNHFSIYSRNKVEDTLYLKNIQFEVGSNATAYYPYAKSNVELTNELEIQNFKSNINALSGTIKRGQAFKLLNIATVNLVLDGITVNADTALTILNLPSGARPSELIDFIATKYGETVVGRGYIETNGNVSIRFPSAITGASIMFNITYSL